MTATRDPVTGSNTPVLRRTLTTWGAISLSIAAMGASLAVNINPQGAGATVGRAVSTLSHQMLALACAPVRHRDRSRIDRERPGLRPESMLGN